jgi:hypothetical protein
MKYLQLILLGMIMFVVPFMPSLVLCGLSLVYLRRHDWERGFFNDKWGVLGLASFLAGLVVFMVGVYIPSRQ